MGDVFESVTVENPKDAGGEGDDTREGGGVVVGNQGTTEDVFVGRFSDSWVCKGCAGSVWKAE